MSSLQTSRDGTTTAARSFRYIQTVGCGYYKTTQIPRFCGMPLRGLPAMSVVGLPQAAVKESRDRVRSAILSAQFAFPAGRITVNLSPADLPKGGGRFDLPIAVALLIASEQLPAAAIANCELYGELSLGGEVRPIQGILPAVMAAHARGASPDRSIRQPDGSTARARCTHRDG
jgi:predicted ATPase with chaperone activity